jgi:hypothetical protein
MNSTDDCNPCPGGYYCDEEAQTDYTKLCEAGYFCRLGATVSTPNSTTDANVCPAGYYCVEGTTEPAPCPPGTYSDDIKLRSQDECMNCTKGEYCPDYGMTETAGPCLAGYYCPKGSSRRDQTECPVGKYCVNGTFDPVDCPRGTFNNETMKASEDECYPCSGGKYCETEGLTEPTGDCAEGYFCPPGTIDREPEGNECYIDHYCPGGVAYPIPCPNYTEANQTQSSYCNLCPQGFYCPEPGVRMQCPEGYYCPTGTGVNWQACPRGTYSDQTGLYGLDQCKPCTEGQYCDAEHLTAPTNPCAAGHYCVYGVDRPEPDGDNSTSCSYYDSRQTGYGGQCPVGHYCEEGSVYPEPCAAGTYAPDEAMDACLPCEPG